MGNEPCYMIDETSGTLWRIPTTSIIASFAPAIVSAKSWTDHIDHAKRDSYTFVNAEVLQPFTFGTPGHVLKASTYTNSVPVVIYTQTVSITHPNFPDYGSTFHWSISFEMHADVWKNVQNQQSGMFMQFGQPITPKIVGLYEQRPSPRDILGSVLVTTFASELRASEREFFVCVSCAPYLYRDCSDSLEQYWRSTRMHKECHPNRLAIQNRIGRESEIRRIRNVHTLLEKAKDPEIECIVRNNADRGMRVLGELMEITNDADCGHRWRKLEDSVGDVCFFGADGLPCDIQSAILSLCVKATFAYPDSIMASRTFAALRSTCKLFNSEASSIGNKLVSSAYDELNAFVLHATPMCESRMSGVASWSYREFGCSPSLLLHGMGGRNDAAGRWQAYMRARTAAGLAANVCTERAKRLASNAARETSRSVPYSARMAKLLGIATTAVGESV